MSFEPWTLTGQYAAVRFTLTALADPGLLPRLLMPFARRDLTPDSFDMVRGGDSLRADIAMARMPAEMVHLVEADLRKVVGVTSLSSRREVTGGVRRCAA